jgi:hypothetical protein
MRESSFHVIAEGHVKLCSIFAMFLDHEIAYRGLCIASVISRSEDSDVGH